MLFSRVPDPPDPSALDVQRVLLATEGRSIPDEAIAFAVELAGRTQASVYVLSIARVHGTQFGMQNPGLFPTRHEWDEHRALVDAAVKAVERRGLDARGRVVATRKATKTIVREAERRECDAIVMAADPPRNRLVADFMWTQEPYRVRQRAKVPVYLVPRVAEIA